jgi:hypothetical protein
VTFEVEAGDPPASKYSLTMHTLIGGISVILAVDPWRM